jgi:hypothetical protein
MKRFLLVGLALATALATAPAAKAGSFAFNVNGASSADGPSISGSGIFSANAIAGDPGAYDIIQGSATITIGGVTYTANIISNPGTSGVSAYPSSSDDLFDYDDIINPGASKQVDSSGLLFQLSGDGALNGGLLGVWLDTWVGSSGQHDKYYNDIIWNEASEDGTWLINNFPGGDALDSFDTWATPEPSSLLLLGTGLLCLAGFLFRKAKPNMVQEM